MKIACCAALIVAFGFVSAAGAATCESIASLDLPNTEVTLAAQVATGAFTAPDQEANDRGIFAALPAFCRVTATLTPSPDSDIKVEVWLPTAGWNGKYRAVGNGAWRGSISYGAMANALRRGYATSSTDTGHVGGSARFGMGHPEKVTHFAYRSEHEMAVAAKAVIDRFYGRPPRFSYWKGCSAGGRQAMMEAQRFPTDFDGIVAGSPGLDWSGRTAQAGRLAHLLQDEQARLTAPKREFADAIRQVGPQFCVLASDVGRKGNPAPADGFATFLGAMRARGFTDEEIVTMSRVNAVPADRACGRIALLKQE